MPRVLSREDLSRPIHAHIGESVVVRLEENPTTGYRWRLNEIPEDKVRVVSDKFSVAGDGYGSGGVRELIFEPLQAGNHVVVLRNSFAGDSAETDPQTRLEIDVD